MIEKIKKNKLIEQRIYIYDLKKSTKMLINEDERCYHLIKDAINLGLIDKNLRLNVYEFDNNLSICRFWFCFSILFIYILYFINTGS